MHAYIRDSVMTMPVDALTRGSGKPSEDTVMTQKLDIFPSKFLWLSLLDAKCMDGMTPFKLEVANEL